MGELKLQNLTDFKDGDDGGDLMGLVVNIREVENGFIFDESDDEGEATYVFSSARDLVDHLEITLGLKSDC